ncbi:helix-hairpin-helix domain-containing protein [Prosthecobacter sp. SYSU 5D2]|uniref:helix-hairpin-helix domain-containing protein n=1 Tax=Prosthecobacter sp. SYSU 5D2 TaxID=3134134 RepID=UPI0031FEEC47
MPARLEDLPNIGKSLAADLRSAGIRVPQDLLAKDMRVLFAELVPVMGHRHDPCVFYTLLAVRHYLQHAEALPWWKFTAIGKEMLGKD